jgi:flavin reductase (DIM6/NTAB) family NADH-FMN oxidoreductase RutF
MRVGLQMAFDRETSGQGLPATQKLVHPDEFRQAFRALASGVSVITFDVGHEIHGFTATSLTSVSMVPPLALFCIGNATSSRAHIERGQTIGISLLAIDQADIARAFASRTPEGGYTDIGIARLGGAPIVRRSIAAMEAEITDLHPAGDHTVCICALHAVHTSAGGVPLIHFARNFHGHRPLIEEV